VSPERRRAAARHLQEDGLSSQRKACELVGVSRSSLRYQPRRRADEEALRERIRQLAKANKRYGYRRITAQLRREGRCVNPKCVHRSWKDEGLCLPRKRPRRGFCGPKGQVKQKASHPNQVWSYDLLEDRTERGHRVRLLPILDEYTRESLAILVDRSIGAEQVVETLKWLFLTRGVPEHIRSDNGPEFIAKAVRAWLAKMGCSTIFITPGSPWENPYIESFIGKLRDECLNREIFANLREAQAVVEAWREEYNNERPHSSLGYLTPAEFARRCRAVERSVGFSLRRPKCGRLRPTKAGRATPSLRPQSEREAVTLSL